MRYVPIQLGGKERRLRYDMNALAEIEGRLGIELDKLTQQSMGFRTIRTFLWAGLIHEEPDLTERDVGAWVDGENFERVSEAVVDGLSQAFAPGKVNGDRTAAGAGTT